MNDNSFMKKIIRKLNVLLYKHACVNYHIIDYNNK